MNHRQLELFILVVDTGSFSKAEEEGFVSKQAIIKQINALETEIGVPLLFRNSKGISTTEAGKIFYNGAQKLLREADDLVNACQKIQNNISTVRIGQVEHQVLLNPVNDIFAKRYPEIKLQKIIHPNHSGEYRVSNDIIDVGETFRTDHKPSETFEYTALTNCSYYVAMAPRHKLATHSTIKLAELKNYKTHIYPVMMNSSYVEAIKEQFAINADNLICRNDFDLQVELVFSLLNSTELFISANPFLLNVPEIAAIPLATDWFQEYGIIYRKNPGSAVEKYIATAKEYYTKSNSFN